MEEKVYLLFTKVKYHHTSFFGRKSVHYEWIQSKPIYYKTLQDRIELNSKDENVIEQYYYIWDICRVPKQND